MSLRVAMPIAHVTGAANYAAYYSGGNPIIDALEYFNRNVCEGIRLQRDPAAPSPLSPSLYDLYAFTDGFLSFQSNALVLRLPRELTAAAVNQYNSDRHFLSLQPEGPQLRHVVYQFDADANAAIGDKIRSVLQDAIHPGRTIVRVLPPGGVNPVTLANFLAQDAVNLEFVVQQFTAGTIELFVQAGDPIGNIIDRSVELRFVDSCANATTYPTVPGGRPLNPAYYLYLVRSAANTQANQPNVTLLTAFNPPGSTSPDTIHPLYFLLEGARVVAAGLPPDLAVDLTAPTPPKPLHVTVPVRNAKGVHIAGRGIPMRALGEFHQSRNAANPFSTSSPIRWRLFGNQAADITEANFGRLVSEVRPGQQNRLPGPGAFDHTFAPTANHRDRVEVYWARYGSIFNVVADAFELPTEILLATACTETATGAWYDADFANSREMYVIRMEPLQRQPNQITNNAAQRQLLTQYMNATGGIGGGGANAYLPVPWNDACSVVAGNPLTWGQLRHLIEDHPRDVSVSPGIMQTLIRTAKVDFAWGEKFYGAGFVNALTIVHNGVGLVAANPPADRGALFSDWFGVAVDADGNDTNNPAAVHADLTKMKRSFHSIIAGALHIKHGYNSVIGPEKRSSNLITDFDLPTAFCWFNDGGEGVQAAAPGDNDTRKWHRLFALLYYSDGYPRNAPRYYNAAVTYFNTAADLQPAPSVRLWTG